LLVAAKADIVPHDVRRAVVLMESTMRGAIDNVARDQECRCAFVRVDSPATVFGGGHVVPEIVHDARAGLFAERVVPPCRSGQDHRRPIMPMYEHDSIYEIACATPA
jgi:hypothetical protein